MIAVRALRAGLPRLAWILQCDDAGWIAPLEADASMKIFGGDKGVAAEHGRGAHRPKYPAMGFFLVAASCGSVFPRERSY